MDNAVPSLADLRASLTPFQKEVLQEIVDGYWLTNKGVSARRLHLKHKDKRKVQAALRGMGGSVVFEVEDYEVNNRYQPSFLGVLLSADGERYERSLVEYVAWVESVVQKDPNKTDISSQEVMAGLGLDLEAAKELYQLIMLGSVFYRFGTGGGIDGHWRCGIFSEVDDLDRWPDRKDFIAHLALKHYDPKTPVLVEERRAKQFGSPIKVPELAPESGGRGGMEIFLSHASKDRDLAEALIALLRAALELGKQQIRCTSVPGYKLAVGVDTDEAIRAEVLLSNVLIGLLTPTSLSSSYVLFELGARWGRSLFLAPLLAKGASAGFLRGPISGFNALPADQETDLNQFLNDVAKELGRKVANASSFADELRAVMRISKEGDVFNRYEGRRVKGRGQRKRDQYFVSQRKTHYLEQEAVAMCDRAKIALDEIDAAEEAWLLQAADTDLNAEQMKTKLQALGLWTPPPLAIAVIPRRRRNRMDGL